MLFQAILATLGSAPPPGGGGTTGGGGGGGTTLGPIGNMYNKSTWADLTDFEKGTGYTVSGGKIQVASGATFLRLPNPTKLDKYTFSAKFKLVSGSETSGGFAIGPQSTNTTVVASAWAICNLGGANAGKVTLKDGYSGNTWTSTTAITANVGDQLQIDFVCSRGTFTATWTNITAGTSTSVQVVNTFTYGGSGIGANTSKMGITGSSAAYEVDAITYSSPMVQGGVWTLGDSITDGGNAGSAAGRWSELLGVNGISAGGGDKSLEILSRMNEVTSWIRPAKVYMMVGTNDIFQAVPSATWQGNINSIVNQLQAQSIVVRLMPAPPSNGADMSPIRNYLTTNYSSIMIDNWPALSNGSTGLNASYNSGDGTHLNAAGNTALYNAIVASGK